MRNIHTVNFGKITIGVVGSLVALLAAELAFAENNLVGIPVVKETIDKGMVIKAEHLGEREVNPNTMANTVIFEKDEVVGKEATRTLRAGNPIYQNYVRISPDVHRNDMVALNYQVGGIQLTAKGRALEDGNVGATISVMNADSNKLIVGTVIAKNKVRVE